MIQRLLCAACLLIGACSFAHGQSSGKDNSIRPYKENPSYWQYKGQPALLLGGTDNDNLFQNDNLKTHLDSLKNVGGNYIRNVMSDRDPGNVKAFYLNKDGKYDLNRWNNAYWTRFENLLKLTSQRNIIVQIEIWDRFDHSRENWKNDPYNPLNNINYSLDETGLDSVYSSHPGQNKQPFFFTVPSLNNNVILLKYQQAFVKKLLSISLAYGNVLYCMDNETSGREEWATYWAAYIKSLVKGDDIYLTEMWDNWDVKSDTHKRTIDHPETYGFIDLSQNSQTPGYPNWENAQYVLDYIKENRRPVNSTKVYGSDQGSWLNRGITTAHGLQTFCRNVIGGFASSRFHRPPSGLGLSTTSINCIRAIRKIETAVKMWDVSPRMDLLIDQGRNSAYLAADEGKQYVIYFPGGGEVNLDLRKFNTAFACRWINIATGEWGEQFSTKGGSLQNISAPDENGWFVVISARKPG